MYLKPDSAERYLRFIAHKLLRQWAAWSVGLNDDPRMRTVDRIVSGLPKRMHEVVKEEYLNNDKRRSERRRACYLCLERRDYRTLLLAGQLLTIERWSTINQLKNKRAA